MAEEKGEFRFEDILVGDDAVELDLYVLQKYFQGFEIPDYIRLLCDH